MSRRPGNTGRRLSDGGSFPFGGSRDKKSQSSPLLSVGLVLVGAFLLIGYSYKSSGGFAVKKDASLGAGGFPGHHRMKVAEQSKFGRMAKLRSPSWWQKYFLQVNLEEDEPATKKFEEASSKISYKPGCQVFHLST